MRTIALSAYLAIALGVLPAHAANEGGNGGDDLRETFISQGREVLQYLRYDLQGSALMDKHDLRAIKLEKTLDIQRIKVVMGPLKDNGGSLADAIIRDRKLLLDKDEWDEILRGSGRHRMVFHEMLRLVAHEGLKSSAKYNDDNYRISKEIPTTLNAAGDASNEGSAASLPTRDSSGNRDAAESRATKSATQDPLSTLKSGQFISEENRQLHAEVDLGSRRVYVTMPGKNTVVFNCSASSAVDCRAIQGAQFEWQQKDSYWDPRATCYGTACAGKHRYYERKFRVTYGTLSVIPDGNFTYSWDLYEDIGWDSDFHKKDTWKLTGSRVAKNFRVAR